MKKQITKRMLDNYIRQKLSVTRKQVGETKEAWIRRALGTQGSNAGKKMQYIS